MLENTKDLTGKQSESGDLAAPQGQAGDLSAGRQNVRGMSFDEGTKALSPKGEAPLPLEGDAATDQRRANPYLDPEVLAGDKTNGDIVNRNWADKGQLFVNGIKAEDVHQTNINDCYFVAVLSAIANQQPDYIRQIIREDSPGKYSVRFFEKVPASGEFKQVWVSVDSYLATNTSGGSEQLYYGHSNDKVTDDKGQTKRELWPSILEKAYAKFKGNYADIDWGNTIYSYEALFGTQGNRVNTGTTPEAKDEVWKKVKEAVDGKQPLVCSTGAHVVTPLSYSEVGGQKKIQVRDQAATNDGADTGVTDYTLDTFVTTFTYIRFADPNAYANSTEGIHLSGDWKTNYGETHLESVEKNKFSGSYAGSSPGVIEYAFQGGKSMFGAWKGKNGETGMFEFTVADDKKSFKGTWGNGASRADGGNWDGTRQ